MLKAARPSLFGVDGVSDLSVPHSRSMMTKTRSAELRASGVRGLLIYCAGYPEAQGPQRPSSERCLDVLNWRVELRLSIAFMFCRGRGEASLPWPTALNLKNQSPAQEGAHQN
jgi:hypothetical protein